MFSRGKNCHILWFFRSWVEGVGGIITTLPRSVRLKRDLGATPLDLFLRLKSWITCANHQLQKLPCLQTATWAGRACADETKLNITRSFIKKRDRSRSVAHLRVFFNGKTMHFQPWTRPS